MTTLSRVALLTVSVLMVALLLTPGSAYAVLIAQDSFDFAGGSPVNYNATTAGRNQATSGGQLNASAGTGQNPSAPFGFTGGAPGGLGAWAGAATSLTKVQDTGLSYVGQPSSGGSVQFDWNTSLLTRMQHRPLSAPPTVTTGDEYWMSGMVQYNALETDNVGGAYAGFGDTSSGSNLNPDTASGAGFYAENPNGVRIGLEATGSGGTMDLVLRHQNTAGLPQSEILSGSIPAATPQLLFVKVDVLAGDDQLSVWVNPANFGNINELGVADFTFSSSAFDVSGALDLFLLQGFDIDNTTGLGGVIFDEFMLGTTFLDVAPNATELPPVPEPSSLLLLGLGALGLMRYTRRRQCKA